jgi:hypothetical protein
MNIYKYIHWLAAGVLVLSISACNLGNAATRTPEDNPTISTPATETSPTEVPATEAPTTMATTPPESGGACDNAYFPVVAGATWNYKLTGPVSDTYIHTILSVESDSFTEQDEFGTGVTRQGKWQCDNGNLIALNPPTGNSANVTAEGVSVNFETKELSGVTIPASINAGDTWSQSLTLEGTQTINGTSYAASNKLTSNCTAIGVESVTVEAGTFDAMRVECQTDMNITIALDPNNPISTPLLLTGINWYAEDVGLVKTSTSSPGLESTTELVSYNIP